MQKNYFRYCHFIIHLLKDLRLKNYQTLNYYKNFYDKLSIVKNSNAFSGFARSYKVEIL